MKEDFKYIDLLTKEKLINHTTIPKSNWEDFNKKFLSFESKNETINSGSNLYTNLAVKLVIIAILIISGILLINLLPGKTVEEYKLIRHKKRIDIVVKGKNIENVKPVETNIQRFINTHNNNTPVIIKKEIIIRDTFYMRDTVTIKK